MTQSSDRQKPTISLTNQIALGLVLGLIAGLILNSLNAPGLVSAIIDGPLTMIGTMFINALRMLVVPLVAFSLICGVAGIGDIRILGRVGGLAFGLYMLTTALAIVTALLLAGLISPGQNFVIEGMNLEAATMAEPPSVWGVLTNIVPTNPFAAFAQGEMLQVIFYVIVLGIAAIMLGDRSRGFFEACEYMNELMMKIVDMVMIAAPYGVFCLIAKAFAVEGFALFGPVLGYVATLVLALAVHLFVTLMLILRIGTGVNPISFLRKMRPAQLFAFSSASSSATIPLTLQCVTQRIGVNNSVASFTVPFGATINMDGTAIMQGVATVFLANVYGVDLGVSGYLAVIMMSVLASVGTAGVPGVGLIMLTMVLAQVGLPLEGVALILGIDRILDMIRTAVNITGDAVVSTVVANREGLFDRHVFNDPDAGEVDVEDLEIDHDAELRLKDAVTPHDRDDG